MSTVASPRLPVLLPAEPRVSRTRRFAGPVVFLAFGLVDILAFGRAHGSATLAFTPEFAKVTVPNLTLPASLTSIVCGALTLLLAAARLTDVLGLVRVGSPRATRRWRQIALGLVLFLFVLALLCWSDASQSSSGQQADRKSVV